MNHADDSLSLATLADLFAKWCALDWSSEHEGALFVDFVEQAKSLTKQHDFIHFEERPFLQFLDKYLQHENLKFRVCVLIFLAEALYRYQQLRHFRLYSLIEERFWLAFNDPHPLVVRFFIRLLNYHNYYGGFYELFDLKTQSFNSIPLSKTHLKSFNIDRLLCQLPSIRTHPEISAEFFWRIVCYVMTCIHLGDGPQMFPYLHKLIEMYLQEPFYFIDPENPGYYKNPYGGIYELKLLCLGFRHPPPHLKRQWLQTALQWFKDFAKNEKYDTEEYWTYEPDRPKYQWPDPFIDDLGITILQTQEIDLLREFVTSYQAPFVAWEGYNSIGTKIRQYTNHGFGHDVLINRATYLLFPHALALGWQEGVHFLLLNFIENAVGRTLQLPIADTDIERFALWGNPDESMIQLQDLLAQYLAAGAPITQELLEELWGLYEYLEDESVRIQLPDGLREQFIQIGYQLYQTRNTPLLTFCVKRQFVPVLLGILKNLSSSAMPDGIDPRAPLWNQMGIVVILEAILERYNALWWETPHPISWKNPWFEVSYGYDDESAFARNALLKQLAEFFLNPIPQKDLWRIALSHLDQTHGIWVLRLLVDLLYFTSAYTSEWLACFTNIGSIWTQNEDVDDIDVNEEEDWAKLIILGCQAHPVAQKLLLQYAENQTHPLSRRELALLVREHYHSRENSREYLGEKGAF